MTLFASVVISLPLSAHVPITGHRGGVWGVENTAGCFRAGAQWFDALEMDTKLTKDSVLVCFHDADFSLFYKDESMTTKYTPEESNIRNHTLAELQAMPITQKTCAGVFTDTICTMGTYLDICRENKVIAYVEIKWVDNYLASNSAAGMPHVMKLIKEHGMLDHCILMSGVEKCINWIRERPEYDSIPVQYLGMTGGSNPSFATITAWAEKHEGDIDPECYQITGKAQVQACHNKNIKVACWNVTNTASYNQYKNYGVDYITVDSLRPIFLKDYTPRTGWLDVKHIPAPLTENPYGWTGTEDMYKELAKDIVNGKTTYHLNFSFSDALKRDSAFTAPATDLNTSGIAVDIKTFDINFFSRYATKWKWLRAYIDARCEAEGLPTSQEGTSTEKSKVLRYNLAAFFANTKGTNPETADFTNCGAASTAFLPYWKYTWCVPSGWVQAYAKPTPAGISKYENGRLTIHADDRVYSPMGARLK